MRHKVFRLEIEIERGSRRGEPCKVVRVTVDGVQRRKQETGLACDESFWTIVQNESSAIVVTESQF